MQPVGGGEFFFFKLALKLRNKAFLQGVKVFLKRWDEFRAFEHEIAQASRGGIIKGGGGEGINVGGTG